jgi:hypothetical protein
MMAGKADRRANVVIAVVAACAIALLWVLPPVGFVACAVMLVIAPPWGKTLTERAVISLLIILGLIAIVFPRAGGTPITMMSSHIALAVLTACAVGLRFIGPFRGSTVPKPRLVDALIGLLAVGTAFWLMAAYLGRSATEIVSGLFFTGWDNHGHFTPFANTYEIGSTTWPTVDGSIAWNQWYPSLHSTVWSLAQLASQKGSELIDRPGLLWPYVQWTSISFALSLAALAWVASDLAARFSPLVKAKSPFIRSAAPVIAVLAFAAFALLGSPGGLFNAGFTNFMMAVAVVTVTAYLSARSWRSASTLGWLLIPLGALAVNGLWTPLVVGLVPSAVIVMIALFRVKKVLAPIWVVVSGILVLGTVYLQGKAIVSVDPGGSTSFIEDLGAIGAGMNPFNIGVAIAAPAIAVLIGIVLFRSGRGPLAIAVAGSSVMVAAFLLVTFSAADSGGISRLGSYYALKTLNALLLMNAPLLAAGAGIGGALVLAALKHRLADAKAAPARGKTNAVIVAVAVGILGVSMFGYVGATPEGFAQGFGSAPGVAAGAARAGSVNNSLVGDAIINARDAAVPYPGKSTLLWDGSSTLVNLWVASLGRVLSKSDQQFYGRLPPFPYGDEAISYVDFAVGLNPSLDLVVLWFRGVSGEQLAPLVRLHPDRITLVKVPMRSSPLCQECSL